MLYLYESHHGGLYLSARDDLDANYCPVCGDCDFKMETYYVENLEDARHLVYNLFSVVLEEGFSRSTWLELLSDLKRLYDGIDFEYKLTKQEWEDSIEYHKRILIEKLEEYIRNE